MLAKFVSAWIIPDALTDFGRGSSDLSRSAVENMVKEELKDWIVVRPGGLVDDKAKGKWRTGEELCSFYPKIAREDVASFVATECVAPGRSSKWRHKSVAVMW